MALTSDPLQTDSTFSASVELQEPLTSPLSEPIETASDVMNTLGVLDSTPSVPSPDRFDQLDTAIAALGGEITTTTVPDQLTGPKEVSNPPLLQSAIGQDAFLTYQPLALQQRLVLEDRPFSLELQSLLPQAQNLEQIQILNEADGQPIDWLTYEWRLPDATLAEKVVIEGLFQDPLGDGMQLDVVVTDTRHDGLGLIGLELDLIWKSDAVELEQVNLTPSLPLFRDTGNLDAAAGSLSGVVAASLPSSGNGEILGDNWRESFAQLNYRLLANGTEGPDLTIIPRNYPARGNATLSAEQVVVVDSQSRPIPVLFGLAQQAQVGEHRLVLQAIDNSGQAWQQTLVLNVLNVNDAPTAIAMEAIEILEDEAFTISLADAFQDDDVSVGDSLTYQLSNGSPDWLVLDERSGLLSGQPGNGEVGSWQIGLEARDQSGATTEQTVKLVVINTNDAPLWNGQPLPEIWVRQDRPFEIRLPEQSFSDVDAGDQLRYSLDLQDAQQLASLLTIDAGSGTISGLLPANETGVLNLQLVATDLAGASASAPLRLRVVDHDFNRSPYRIGPELEQITLQEGETFQLEISNLFQDDDIPIGDRLRFEVDAPNWLQFDPQRNSLIGSADNDAVGRHAIRLQAIDRAGSLAEKRFLLQVENNNQAPFGLDGAFDERPILVSSDLWLDARDLFGDLDLIHGDELSFSLQTNRKSNLGFDPGTGELRFSPDESDKGLHRLFLTATDRSGASSLYQLNLDVITAEQGGDMEPTYSEDNLLNIQSNLYLSASGESIRPEQLGSLPAGSQLSMRVELTDQRQNSLNSGVIGLDLDLRWTGLELKQPADRPLEESISEVFPLFRQVDRSRLDENRLRFSAASLPALGLGEALGDQRAETFVVLDFELTDPTAPIRLDLMLNQETAGGLGLALADGSGGVGQLEIKSLSSQTLIDRLIRQGENRARNIRLRDLVAMLSNSGRASSSFSAIATTSPIREANPKPNLAPLVIGTIGSTRLKEKSIISLDLSELFDDPDTTPSRGSTLSYNLKVRGESPIQTERLSQLLRIDQSTETPRLLLKTPGLLEILSGNVEIIASDGQLSTSQSFDLELIPSAEMVSINASPPRRYDTQGESVPLGKLLQAQPLFFEDEADTTELEINSSQPVRVHLSDSFRALAGLSAAEAGRLERQWQNIDASGEDSDTTQLTIPISELLALLADNGDVFDLNWLEITPESNSDGAVFLAVSTSTRVRGDDGSRFGIQQSPWMETRLIVPQLIPESAAELTTPVQLLTPAPTGPEARTAEFPTLDDGRVRRDMRGNNQPLLLPEPTAGRQSRHADEPASPLSESALKRRPLQQTGDPDEQGSTGIEPWQQRRRVEARQPDAFSNILRNLLEAFQHPASLAGLVITMMTMPAGGERGLRSLVLQSKLGRAIQLRRRNPELKAAWHLRLCPVSGTPVPLQLLIEHGRISLQSDQSHAPTSLLVTRDLDQQASLWRLICGSSHPGALLAEVSRMLERVLHHQEEELNWRRWLDHMARHRDPSASRDNRIQLQQLQQSLLLAQGIDQAMADALMVSELLNCQVQLGLMPSMT